MPEETKNDDIVIKTLKEEYEKKLQEQKKEYETKLEQQKKELEEKTANQVRSILSGRNASLLDDGGKKEDDEQEEKSYYEIALEETRKNFKLK